MSTDPYAQLIEGAEAYAKFGHPPVHSFLVLHHGEIAAERYWWGYAPTSYQPMFSVTKSVLSAVVGLALGDGKVALADTMAKGFPDLVPNPDVGAITVEHLLTMTAGFAPLKGKSPGDDSTTANLNRPLAAPPGENFYYDNDAPDLLVALVEQSVGERFLDYAQRRLFAPLGIWQDVPKSQRRRLWQVDRQNRPKGAYGLHLTTREMAAFGRLYLQCGRWADVPILPADYVTASTTAHADGGYPEFVSYGYLWWVVQGGDFPAFYASGMGGQYIYVVPALDLVAVITSTARNADGRKHRTMLARLATQYALAQDAA